MDRQKYGPWALIVGGSEGAGAEFARKLAASGFKVILVARKLENAGIHAARVDVTLGLGTALHGRLEELRIEDATVEWKEAESPYHAVARISIPRQRFDDDARMARCEQVGFNPWHCLAEHRPLGSMNRARRSIYQAMAAFRNETVET